MQSPVASDSPTIGQILPYLECKLCQGVYRDAHTINECMCTFCKICIVGHFQENNTSKCPDCKAEIGGRPEESLIKDLMLQNMVDWVFPEFKERDEKLKQQLL